METVILPDTRVAIIGLGLMGGSLAMALRGKCRALLGIDSDPETRALASRWNLVDQIAGHPDRLLPKADLVVLAAPVRAIMTLIGQLPDLHPGRSVVMDLGSTKAQIINTMAKLPERFDPIGAHPMAGKERASLANADAELYQGAPFALTPLERTSPHARALALELVQAVGAKPLWLDPDTHDRLVCATSHLPYLVSNALAAVTPAEAAPLVGPGFRSTARLAPSTLEMMLDILATNRANLLDGVARYRKRIEELDAALRADNLGRLTNMLLEGSDNFDRVTKYQKGK